MKKRGAALKPHVIAVVGPTASGKTSLGAAIAEALDGEVISADSMQLYEGMDIATAKPTKEETRGVPHHLIGVVPQSASFSVAQYKARCQQTIDDVISRGKVPVLVGGTGLYLDAMFYNTKFFDEADTSFRETLTARAEEEGTETLLDELRSVDPDTAAMLNVYDKKRIIRALEVYYATGKTMREQREASHLEDTPYDFCVIGLSASDRAYLYDRINRRVDQMVSRGLVEEAEAFCKANPAGTAKQAIGYKELAPYFAGACTLEQALDKLKMETRRYAKRQLTWFRRNDAIHWLMIDQLPFPDLLRESLSIIARETGIVPNDKGENV